MCNYVLFHDRNNGAITHANLYHDCDLEDLMRYVEQFEIYDAIEEEQQAIQESEQRKQK